MAAGAMSDFRSIEPIAAVSPPALSAGPEPQLRWIDVSLLVVENAYQRVISKRGLQNIRQIVESFRWSRFTPVIVSPRPDGRFAIIDGQHRATAAATLKIKQVPAQIVEMGARERAEAFTFINGAVTALTPLARFHAAVAAEDPVALSAKRALDAAGAGVCTYVKPSSEMKAGETLAAVSILKSIEQYGEECVTTALRALVARNSPGVINLNTVVGVSRFIQSRPRWGADEIVEALSTLDFERLMHRAQQRRVGVNGRVAFLFTEELQAAIPGDPKAFSPPSSAPKQTRAAFVPQTVAGSNAPRFALDDELVSMVATKAGISFGCSRAEVINPNSQTAEVARAVVINWLLSQGYAAGVVLRRLPVVDLESIGVQAAQAKQVSPTSFARFESLVAEGMKSLRGAA